MQLDEATINEQREFEPRKYLFAITVLVDKKKLNKLESISRIRFSIAYGDTLVKDWREEIKQCFGDEFISQRSFLFFDQNNSTMPIKVYVQTTDLQKRVIDNISENFSFIKAASSDGIPIKGMNDSKARVRICLQDGDFFEENKDAQNHYSFKISMEYNPLTIP